MKQQFCKIFMNIKEEQNKICEKAMNFCSVNKVSSLTMKIKGESHLSVGFTGDLLFKIKRCLPKVFVVS